MKMPHFWSKITLEIWAEIREKQENVDVKRNQKLEFSFCD